MSIQLTISESDWVKPCIYFINNFSTNHEKTRIFKNKSQPFQIQQDMEIFPVI